MNSKAFLHEHFNPRSDNIPPVRAAHLDRVGLAKLYAELGFQRGVEIGTADGRHALILCENIPGLSLSCIDPWEPYHGNPRGGGVEQQHNNYKLAQERLKPYGAQLIRKLSMDALADFPDGSLDFVYIDGNHKFDYVMLDLIHWTRKVRRGGIIAGHDYYRFKWAGVVNAVDAYTVAHQIQEWYIDDERETTFFWANEWQ